MQLGIFSKIPAAVLMLCSDMAMYRMQLGGIKIQMGSAADDSTVVECTGRKGQSTHDAGTDMLSSMYEMGTVVAVACVATGVIQCDRHRR